MPRSMQKDYVDNAKLMSQKEFTPIAAACVKRFMEAVRQGKMDAFYSDTQLGSDEQFSELSRSTGFLGRLQLFTKGDAINEGLIPPGTYGIPELESIKLRTQIDVLPLARRTKALDMSEQTPITAYDAKSEQFLDIAARSGESDSKCMYGTSFLVFEPRKAVSGVVPGPSAQSRATSPCSFLFLRKTSTARKRPVLT